MAAETMNPATIVSLRNHQGSLSKLARMSLKLAAVRAKDQR